MRVKNPTAYTLIELLCAIAIIAILAGLVLAPLTRAWKRAHRLQHQIQTNSLPVKILPTTDSALAPPLPQPRV